MILKLPTGAFRRRAVIKRFERALIIKIIVIITNSSDDTNLLVNARPPGARGGRDGVVV